VPIADIGPTSDEHSDAWQDNPDLGELARLRIIEVQRAGPTARNHARARPCRDWGNCRRTGETVDLIPTVPHHFHLGIELVLIRHVATVAAIAVLLGPVSLAQAQSDNEREEMLRGGATKKGIYNIFGFDGTNLGRTTVRYDSKYAPGTIVINTGERRLYLVQGGGSALRYGQGAACRQLTVTRETWLMPLEPPGVEAALPTTGPRRSLLLSRAGGTHWPGSRGWPHGGPWGRFP
jgi:hypothetical protein